MPKLEHLNAKYLDTKWTVDKVREEINNGLEFLKDIKEPVVSIFGSHKTNTTSPYYKQAEAVAYELGKCGYAIVTGGGPGIMQAANEGATRAKTRSIGIRASLIRGEKVDGDIFTNQLSYHFLFVRRFLLSIKSDALLFFPGGYGTLNEFFEYVVLVQLNMIDQVPIVLVGKEYWHGLFTWLEEQPGRKDYFIKIDRDLDIVQFCDTTDEIINLIQKKCPIDKPKK